MPGINDTPEQVQPIVDRAREADATFLGGVALHLRDEVRDVFFAWLEAKRPDLLPRYEKLYQDGRAYMPLRAAQPSHAASSEAGAGAAAARGRGGSLLPELGGHSEPLRGSADRGRRLPEPSRADTLPSLAAGDSQDPASHPSSR